MALWRTSYKQLVKGRETLDFLVATKGAGAFKHLFGGAVMRMWRADQVVMHSAVPFAFTDEVTQALQQASRTIPVDTPLGRQNMPEQHAWWYFEKPLLIKTTLSKEPVVAMSLGWLSSSFIVSCWTAVPTPPPEERPDDVLLIGEVINICPSQVFTWQDGETLDQLLKRCREEHQKLYGPGGQYHNTEILGEELFMEATDRIARFILAAVAWFSQKIAVTEDKILDRPERRRVEKATGRKPSPIKLVYLRKREQRKKDGEVSSVEWSCRWVVGHHWKLQAHGPRHSLRKLVFILPYVKGPDDKPLKEDDGPTAYVVNR